MKVCATMKFFIVNNADSTFRMCCWIPFSPYSLKTNHSFRERNRRPRGIPRCYRTDQNRWTNDFFLVLTTLKNPGRRQFNWLTTETRLGTAGVVNGGRSFACKVKETGQRLLTTHRPTYTSSGAGMNLKVGEGTDPAWRAGKILFGRAYLLLALKAQLVVLVSAFVMVSTVWSACAPRALWSRRHCTHRCYTRTHRCAVTGWSLGLLCRNQ